MHKIFFILVPFCLSLVATFSKAEQKTLRWAGDSTGGAPFVLLDPNDPTNLIGFEVEVANLLAQELGRKPEFIQNQWDGLIPGLKAGNYDIVINAVEITDDRKKEVEFSNPYFFTFEQMTVRKGSYEINSLSDLRGKKAGTIISALAERILHTQPGIDVLTYDSQTPLYDDLANGRLDAVLLDQPAALYYGGVDKRLKNLPKNYGELAYGFVIRKGETELLAEVNTALQKMISSGKLREIYERWAVWNPVMGDAFKDTSHTHAKPTEFDSYMLALGHEHDWKDKLSQYLSYVPLLAKGAVTTLQLSILAMFFAVGFGLMIALVRLYAPQPFPWITLTYVEFVRGTPLLIQLFFIYYGLPNLGIKLEPFTAAVLGLALNYSAYESEVYRAGIGAIPISQMEAALALGMNKLQALWHVIIPQAMRIVIPPMTNDFISLLKDSSLVSVITMVELTRVYGQLASTYYDYFGIGILTALMYFLIGLPFVRLSRYAEKRLKHDGLSGERFSFRATIKQRVFPNRTFPLS